jgi:hypothetical protein
MRLHDTRYFYILGKLLWLYTKTLFEEGCDLSI